jgi:hypothetical protein
MPAREPPSPAEAALQPGGAGTADGGNRKQRRADCARTVDGDRADAPQGEDQVCADDPAHAYSAHVLIRLQRQERATGDVAIRELIRECEAYPGVGRPRGTTHAIAPVLTTLGAPYDVTLDEIVIESFFPADAGTARAIGMQA